ncbi:MAG: glycosyltransferase family 2 protein [Candidatus ainarchaeum sp.]|nr:glycosyltransferase family 2 protein [Candidatus ainarchaeum sp.]
MEKLVSMALACYNQADFLEENIEKIKKVLDNAGIEYEIILYDDKSTDNTAELIKKMAKKDSGILCFFHEKNMGRGKTTADAIMKSKGEICGFIDTDLESDVEYMPKLIMAIKQGWDVSIGNRKYKINRHSIMRLFLSRGFHCLAKIAIGTKLNDTESGFKFFNTKKIIPVLKEVQSNRWFWDTELMVLAEKKGLKIKEIWVPFIKNTEGKTTMKFARDIHDYWAELLKFRKRLKQKKLL